MAETIIKDKTFDEERALYGSVEVSVENCRFDGPADGESALKESRHVVVKDTLFNLRYPLWHVDDLKVNSCVMTDTCRAALWYTTNAAITNTRLHGIKALRECRDITMDNCSVISPEFGWSVSGLKMKDTTAESEYFMMRSDHLLFDNVTLKGKYSFQYISDATFENCTFDTKDAFWHAKNVVVRNSVINGEYLAWYCENVTFENCTIRGTQPLCYCKGLKLIKCSMEDADLAFEKSDVEALITTPMISIKNPHSGLITLPKAEELIFDDETSTARIIQTRV